MSDNIKTHCNLCGNLFSVWDENENFTINKPLGYGTKYDGDRLNLRLCCSCIEKIIENCAINPVTENE